MTGSKLLTKLLRYKGFRAVRWWFEKRSHFIVVVKPHKNGRRCPECGRRGSIVQVLRPRLWQDMPVCGRTVLLQYSPREVCCPTHGRLVEEIPWADRFSRVTYRLEYALLKYSQVMTQKAAAELLHIPRSTFSDLLHRAITRIREGHRLRNLRTIGIDEISLVKSLSSCKSILAVGSRNRDIVPSNLKRWPADHQKGQYPYA